MPPVTSSVFGPKVFLYLIIKLVATPEGLSVTDIDLFANTIAQTVELGALWDRYGSNGRLSGTIEGSRLTGFLHCSQNYAFVQNYVNNGNLPGKSAAS